MDFAEVVICFGGKFLCGNCVLKMSVMVYVVFSLFLYLVFVRLGVGVDWNYARLLRSALEYAL